MKLFKTFFVMMLGFFLVSTVSCKSGKTNKEKFDKIEVGMTPRQVEKIMGKAQDKDHADYFEFYYWFDGASSMNEAQELSEEGKAIKYYCVIFFAEDGNTFKIKAKEDILTGIWGVK